MRTASAISLRRCAFACDRQMSDPRQTSALKSVQCNKCKTMLPLGQGLKCANWLSVAENSTTAPIAPPHAKIRRIFFCITIITRFSKLKKTFWFQSMWFIVYTAMWYQGHIKQTYFFCCGWFQERFRHHQIMHTKNKTVRLQRRLSLFITIFNYKTYFLPSTLYTHVSTLQFVCPFQSRKLHECRMQCFTSRSCRCSDRGMQIE